MGPCTALLGLSTTTLLSAVDHDACCCVVVAHHGQAPTHLLGKGHDPGQACETARRCCCGRLLGEHILERIQGHGDEGVKPAPEASAGGGTAAADGDGADTAVLITDI